MKVSEAKQIVAKMINWSMLGQGVPLDKWPDPITENLQTLLRANRIVEQANQRSKKRMKKRMEEGKLSGSRKIHMTIADRGIAALYVAANFQGDDPEHADILAMHGSSCVICLDKNQIQ
jgi:hypothetical protein